MAGLKLDGSDELSHGRALSARKGVADGLQGDTSHESDIRPDHKKAYLLGRESGQSIRQGIVDEITWDRRGTPPPHPQGAGYLLGRRFGECLAKKIAEAVKP